MPRKRNRHAMHDDGVESSARLIESEEDENASSYLYNDLYGGFSSKSDFYWNNVQNYLRASRLMMGHSLSHLRNPVTIIIILLLSVCYILLNVAGNVGFSFYSGKIVQYVNTNLDIVVNAFLGFFFGPVTSAISVTLCCIAKMIVNKSEFFIGYVLGSACAGFIHGWFLYGVRNAWFRTWTSNFHSELALRVLLTRFAVSAVVNIGLMSLIFKIFIGYPFTSFIMNYSKSDVPLNSFGEFVWIFFVGILFESLIVYLALLVCNFVAVHAFPNSGDGPTIIINEDGDIENPEEFDD